LERTSVILPTYNRADFLVEAVDSVLNQTLPPAEVLVMDDGSTDDTALKMQPYGDRIRYVQKKNSGKADTINQALKLVQYPLVWIMDDDDIAKPNALKSLTNLLNNKPDIGIAYGKYERFHINEKTKEKSVQGPGYWADCSGENFFQTILQDFFVHHPGMLVRKSTYDAAGPFSLEYPRLEDYEMLVRLAQVTKAANTNDIVFEQRQHDGDRVGGLSADKRTQRWIDEERQFFSKLYDQIPLASYINSTDEGLPPSKKREALIQRGVVMARKKLWTLALNDLIEAAKLDVSETDLSECETNALRYILFSKYGSPEFIENSTISDELKSIASLNQTGKAIVKVIARSQLWFIRNSFQNRDIKSTMRHARSMLALYAAG